MGLTRHHICQIRHTCWQATSALPCQFGSKPKKAGGTAVDPKGFAYLWPQEVLAFAPTEFSLKMMKDEATLPPKLFAFHNNRLLLKRLDDTKCSIPWLSEVEQTGPSAGERLSVHLSDGSTAFAQSLSQPIEGEGWMLSDLRAAYDKLSIDDYRAAGKAWEVVYWDLHSRFCPACGTPTVLRAPIMKQCPACQYEVYPPIATAIIVLIRRGEQALLVRARNFRGKFHGLVAGFLEPGETLEECVRREVNEETGLAIRNISYFGSQPWPYPCGLMVGFTAEYAGGEIELRDGELTTAAFFSKDNLPELPQKLSIARRLIDSWIAELS